VHGFRALLCSCNSVLSDAVFLDVLVGCQNVAVQLLGCSEFLVKCWYVVARVCGWLPGRFFAITTVVLLIVSTLICRFLGHLDCQSISMHGVQSACQGVNMWLPGRCHAVANVFWMVVCTLKCSLFPVCCSVQSVC